MSNTTLQDTEKMGWSAHLGDSVRVSEDDTDLRGRETLLGELEDVLADLLRGRLEPRGSGSLVGKRRGGDTLSGSVHSISSNQTRGEFRWL